MIVFFFLWFLPLRNHFWLMLLGIFDPGEQIRWQEVLNIYRHKEAAPESRDTWGSLGMDGSIAGCEGYVPSYV
jgi:hypothetical protein